MTGVRCPSSPSVAAKINANSEDWRAVREWAEKEREEFIKLLIAGDHPEARGRIKQLDDLLRLPGR